MVYGMDVCEDKKELRFARVRCSEYLSLRAQSKRDEQVLMRVVHGHTSTALSVTEGKKEKTRSEMQNGFLLIFYFA